MMTTKSRRPVAMFLTVFLLAFHSTQMWAVDMTLMDSCPPGTVPLCLFGTCKCVRTSSAPSECANADELAANFKWLHDDSKHGGQAARSRGNILRAISVSLAGDIDQIRDAYKEGQKHNSHAASLIDNCDDSSISRIAYTFAENVVRLKSCKAKAPAASATCTDFKENLRWSVLESGNCAPYSRHWLSLAMQEVEYDKLRAEWVRRAIQVAQGHNHPVAASADFISDKIVISIAKQVYEQFQVGSLEHRAPKETNPFTKQNCPGVSLYNSYE